MNKLVLGSLGLSLLGVVGLACTGSASSQASAAAPAKGDGPEADRSCKQNEDCAVVEVQCCDHCNGGDVEAFRKDKAAAYRPKDCGATVCTEMGCGAAVAECIASRCEARIQPLAVP